jgi:hypothetical protein
MTEFDLGPGLRLEEQITASEGEGIHARWEFGRWLLSQRVGKQLPKGLLHQLVEVTGTNATELKYRMVFAERYTIEDAVVTAVTTCKSWTEIRDGLPNLTPRPRRYEKRHKAKENQLSFDAPQYRLRRRGYLIWSGVRELAAQKGRATETLAVEIRQMDPDTVSRFHEELLLAQAQLTALGDLLAFTLSN